ncbi:hypothetical protein Droror1_Dr00007462 [Drosera rotundifolia]
MDIWSWICGFNGSNDRDESSLPLTFELLGSKFDRDLTRSRSIQLRAQRSLGSNNESLVTFLVSIQGFNPKIEEEILWESCTCDLSSGKLLLPLILQLIQEIIDRTPTKSTISTGHGSQVVEVRPEPMARLLETYSPRSLSGFFNVIFITRLFWLCACDAPTEVGSLYFDELLTPGLDLLSREKHAPVLKSCLLSVGVDVELCITRSIGYVVTKWLMLKELRVGLHCVAPQVQPSDLGISYAYESHGLWVLKGYAPVQALKSTSQGGQAIRFHFVDPTEVALRYALAHQQLEAVIQVEYTVGYFDDYVQVTARVDNFRFHVVKLGSAKKDDMEDNEEVYFPSKVQVWVGPEAGATYVRSVSVSSSTMNVERHNETQKVMKGSFAKTKIPKIKALARTTTRMKMKNWRCDQDVEGNTVIYDAIFCDNKTGLEVYNMKPLPSKDVNAKQRFGDNLRDRYRGADRPFLKSGGLILGGDQCKGEAKWRLSKGMEESVLKWRIGGRVWMSYWPNNIESSYHETRCIEWCHEIDLPLVQTSSMT